MRKILQAILIVILVLVTGIRTAAQAVVIDSSKVRVENKSGVNNQDRKAVGTEIAQQAQQKGSAADNNPSKAVRRVNSGRPDLSKSKGARPPVIIRPTGKVIPKGVGKPAGAGKKGGR
jgi:hypothetical protein